MGAILNEIKDNEYWRLMGYQTFRSYIADPEIGIKQSSAYHAMKLVSTFSLEETEGVEYSKLITIVPHITDDNRDDLLEKARSLSRSDLQKELTPGDEPIQRMDMMPDVITMIDEKLKRTFRSEVYTKGWTEGLQELKKDIQERHG
jgi:hypothetical protein